MLNRNAGMQKKAQGDDLLWYSKVSWAGILPLEGTHMLV